MPLSLGVASGAGYLKNPAEPFLLGYRVNWVENPSFEVNTAGWGSVGGATISRDTVNYRSGAASLKVVNASASATSYADVPLVAGSGFYTISAYVKLETGATTANYFIRQLQYENTGGGTTVAAGNIGIQSLSVTGNWVRLTGVINKAAAANFLTIRVATNSTTSGDIFYVDDVMVEKGNTAGTYFDGDTGFWAGTAHDSFSGFTPYS
jgi:hypothetical protein